MAVSRKLKVSALVVGLWAEIAIVPTLAQNITLDGTLGEAKTLTGTNYTIRQEDGQTVGSNLFHSFGKFGLDAGEAAIFQSNPNIQNILSRVTGGSSSFIDGMIKTESASVNLFLINPSGITFGANASLNVSGSFVATSANAIQFGDKGFFSATEPESPALLTVNPSALFFNQIQAGQIKNQSITPLGKEANGAELFGLRVPDGSSLLLVGGNILIDGGGLNALGGRIELAGVGGTGTIGLDIDGSKLSLNVPDNITLADVSIINGSQVRVIGSDGSSITVHARNLEIKGKRNLDIEGRSQILAGIRDEIGSPERQAGDITINVAENITIQGSTIQNVNKSSEGGNIFIQARNLELRGGSAIIASVGVTPNPPNSQSGDITLSIAENLIIQELSTIQNLIFPGTTGNGGNINITTGSFSLGNGAALNNAIFGKGNAGDITINARDTVSIDGISYNGSMSSAVVNGVLDILVMDKLFRGMGKGGDITITTSSLSLTNGSRLVTSILGTGDAGNITIVARDTISFDGVGSDGEPSGAFSNTLSDVLLAITDEGDITIIARDTISSNDVSGVGNSGNISIDTQQLTIQNGARITASNEGIGNAGILNITTRNLTLDQGSITTTNLSGNGGNIENLQVRDLLLLRNQSQISTTAGTEVSGGGNGGNININAGFIVAVQDENSDITADAFEGMGGNISITTNRIFGITFRNQPTPQSDITASNRYGINGIIDINTPDINPISALATLPVNPVDAGRLIAQNVCATRNSQVAGGSSFVITGKGGLPQNPNETLTNLTGTVDWATNDRSQARIQKESSVVIRSRPQSNQSEPITPIQGWLKNADGTITLTTKAPTVTPQSPQFTPQDCSTAS